MSFKDLLLPNAPILVGEMIPYTIGTSFFFPLVVTDNDAAETMLTFSSGFTAKMVLNQSDGANVLTFTHTLTSGRQINLAGAADYSLAIESTPAGMAALSSYEDRALTFNLIVTRTVDQVAVDLMRDCAIVPTTENA